MLLHIVISLIVVVLMAACFKIGQRFAKLRLLSDSDLLNYLEAQTLIGSKLAKQLVEYKKQAPKEVPIQSFNNTWKLFLQDIRSEKTDAAKLECLKQWLNRGHTLNEDEIVKTCALFSCAESRNAAREVFVVKKDDKKKDIWAFAYFFYDKSTNNKGHWDLL